MSRLTEKKFLDNFKAIKNISPNYVASKEELMYEKLGKLEDLEEQLGCPLEVVIKALKEGIYQADGGRRRFPFIEYNSATDKFFFGFGTYCNVEDYKKAWWLREDKME